MYATSPRTLQELKHVIKIVCAAVKQSKCKKCPYPFNSVVAGGGSF
jgi:hypothetical protein